MFRPITTRRFEPFLAGLLILATSGAHADPIAASYTVTDLGIGQPTFSKDASGNQVVIGSDGHTAYPFPQTFTGTPIDTPANFPVPEPAPPTYGGPYTNSSVVYHDTAVLYPNGIATAVDAVFQNNPVYGAAPRQDYQPYYVGRNPDGSWGQPVAVGAANETVGSGAGGPGLVNIQADKAGDILVTTQIIGSQYTYTLYNINTKSSTDLSTLPALASGGFSLPSYDPDHPSPRVVSMDDDGRILLWAAPSTNTGSSAEELLLLTPAGTSSDPIAFNTPEPGSLAVMAMAMAAFAARRARGRRGRKTAG